MKKTLLTLAAVAMTASASWADQTTMVFYGTEDIGGLTNGNGVVLTRQSGASNPVASNFTGEFGTDEVKYSLEGVDMDLKISEAGDYGFILYNCTGNNFEINGITLRSKTPADLTLTVPGGKITAVTINLVGNITATSQETDCVYSTSGNKSMTTQVVDPEKSATKVEYKYSWSSDEGSESVEAHLNAAAFYSTRTIRSIEVTYQPALGDKQPSGLAFNSENVDYIFGNTFTAPTLSNPNNLDITWSSSNEEVATVDENGDVNFTGTPGSTTITASTDGNDDFAKGKVSYKVNVTGNAKNVKELYQYAPLTGDKVYLDFPLTVTYAATTAVFAVDAEGNACQILDEKAHAAQKATSLKVGDIIPGGYMVSWGSVSAPGAFDAPSIPAVTETTEVTYPSVSSINYAQDANRVVILKDVTFTSNTEGGYEGVTGTDANGTSYKFTNGSSNPAGKYDVTVVVKHYVVNNRTFDELQAIAFEGIATKLNVTTNYLPIKNGMLDKELQDLLVVESKDVEDDGDEKQYDVVITGQANVDEITVTIQPLSGSNGYMGGINGVGGSPLLAKAAATAEEDGEGGPLMGTNFTFKVDGTQYIGSFVPYTLVDGEPEPNMDIMVNVAFNVEKIVTYPNALTVTAPENNAYDGEDVDPATLPIQLANDNTAGSNEASVEKLFPGFPEMLTEMGAKYYFAAKGTTENKQAQLNIAIPAGFDGFIYRSAELPGTMEPLDGRRKANIAEFTPDSEFDEFDSYEKYDAQTGLLFTPNGRTYLTELYLTKGDEVVSNFPIYCVTNFVSSVVAAPEFPEEFAVAVSDENLEVSQELDGEDYYIYVNGETESDTVTVTVEVPEGWDGFYAAVWGEDSGEGDATPYARAKAASVDTSDEDMWMPLEYLTEGMPLKDTNTLTFPVGEEGMSMGIMFLYKGDNALYLPINVMPSITKPEPPAELEFPEELTISASVPGLSISQTRVDVDYTQVTIAGSTDAESVTITFEVPEGWDGFYGMTSSEFDPGDAEPLAKARKAAATDDEDMWMPAEMLPQMIPGMKKTNTLTFTTDEEEQTGMLFLYKGDQVYMHQIAVNFDVTTGIDAIEAVDSAARYFNLQGVEVKNPETGVYVKVANGKVSKVIVK